MCCCFQIILILIILEFENHANAILQSLSRHDGGRHSCTCVRRVENALRHEPTFLCSSLLKSKPTWPCTEGFTFEAEHYFCGTNVDKINAQRVNGLGDIIFAPHVFGPTSNCFPSGSHLNITRVTDQDAVRPEADTYVCELCMILL